MDTAAKAFKSTPATKSVLLLDHGSETDEQSNIDSTCRFSPADFCEFLPWACKQLEVDADVKVTKVVQEEYLSLDHRKTKGKGGPKHGLKSATSHIATSDKALKSTSEVFEKTEDDAYTVNVTAQFSGDHIVNLKIDKTKRLPRGVLRLIRLIIKFHTQLDAISIHSGADQYTIYELSKILPISNITEVYLDNTFIQEGNHDLLLETGTLKVMSLCRCSVGDEVVKKIAAKLHHPLPASLCLTVLSLSSNRITDEGAKYLGRALRTNRKLRYLNLASNMITDNGIQAIINVLAAFPLSNNELLMTRHVQMSYYKRRNAVINTLMEGLRASGDKHAKKPGKVPPTQGVKKKRLSAGRNPEEGPDFLMEGVYYEKAKEMAKNIVGECSDPLAKDSFCQNGIRYSNGNNALAYLNVAYNNLSYNSLKLFLNVLTHQRSLTRLPRGLVNVTLEGNPLPMACKELAEIDQLLGMGLASLPFIRRPSSRRLKQNSGTKVHPL